VHPYRSGRGRIAQNPQYCWHLRYQFAALVMPTNWQAKLEASVVISWLVSCRK
jgi:hypothetical protein